MATRLIFLTICHPWLLYNIQKYLGLILFHVITIIAFFFIVEYRHHWFDQFDYLNPQLSEPTIDIINMAIFITAFITINILIGFIISEYTKYTIQLNNALKKSQDLVHEKEETQKEIELTNKELKRSLTELEQLAYASSHDLKMPLRGIVSFSQLMKRRYGSQLDKDGNEYLDYIVKEGKRQFEQIEGLLNYLKADQEEKNIKEINPNEILNDILVSLRGVVEEKSIQIIKNDLPNIYCDASDFEQVMYNLLSNAVKFSDPFKKSTISIQAIQNNGFYEFSIKDNGLGFEMEYHEQMFGIFKTLSSADRQKGSGIGLSICKKIVNNYGGKVWAEAIPNEGSTFYFTFPVDYRPI